MAMLLASKWNQRVIGLRRRRVTRSVLTAQSALPRVASTLANKRQISTSGLEVKALSLPCRLIPSPPTLFRYFASPLIFCSDHNDFFHLA